MKFCSSVALATVQVPVGTHSCQTGWYRQRTFPSLQKVLLDSLGIECNSSKLFEGRHTNLRDYNNIINNKKARVVITEHLPRRDLVPGVHTSLGRGCSVPPPPLYPGTWSFYPAAPSLPSPPWGWVSRAIPAHTASPFKCHPCCPGGDQSRGERAFSKGGETRHPSVCPGGRGGIRSLREADALGARRGRGRFQPPQPDAPIG